ncbi:MAG: helix-turn-helix transcriptional regulator [Acidobacteria bacterium]|nr:helix-turn-helix transcriptional regulator [Acidobacteriota bacterium]
MSPHNVPERGLLVAHFVRQRRRGAKLTQHDLADLAGVGKRFVVELEAGKQTLRLDKVDQVLRAFGKHLGPVDLPKAARETSTPEQ